MATTTPLASESPNALPASSFGTLCFLHPILKSVLDTVLSMLRNRSGVSIISVVGPSGIGKTTLCRLIYASVVKAYAAEIAADKGLIPVAYLKVPAYEHSRFKWNDFWELACESLQEIHIDKKTLPKWEDSYSKDESTRNGPAKRDAPGAKRRAYVKALYYRKVKIQLLDEAQELKLAANARGQNAAMNVIKTLAESPFGDEHNTLFVLVGTYELINLLRQNAQLAKRNWTIEFPRYRLRDGLDPKTGQTTFQRIVRYLQHCLPLECKPSLEEQVEYLWQMSLGCVGVLKPWLDRALQNAIERSSSFVTEEDLNAKEKNPHDLKTMYDEIVDGETRLSNPEAVRENLITMLKNESTNSDDTTAPADKMETQQGNKPLRSYGRGVGQPKPKRYETHQFIGNGHA